MTQEYEFAKGCKIYIHGYGTVGVSTDYLLKPNYDKLVYSMVNGIGGIIIERLTIDYIDQWLQDGIIRPIEAKVEPEWTVPQLLDQIKDLKNEIDGYKVITKCHAYLLKESGNLEKSRINDNPLSGLSLADLNAYDDLYNDITPHDYSDMELMKMITDEKQRRWQTLKQSTLKNK